MKSSWCLCVRHVLLLHTFWLACSICASAVDSSYSNGTGIPTTTNPPALARSCSTNACTIRVAPTTLTYPYPLNLKTVEITATVIPVIKSYPNGRVVTESSTYQEWNPTSNVTFTPPTTTQLTWSALGTQLTYPTVYVAYPTPEVVFSTQVSNTGQITAACMTQSTRIPVPTTQFIYPSTDSSPSPGADLVLSYLEQLPLLTSLVHGDPRRCSHGALMPTFATVPAIGFEPVMHTTVSILTTTGAAVTLAVIPFDEGGGTTEVAPTGPAQPQSEGGSGSQLTTLVAVPPGAGATTRSGATSAVPGGGSGNPGSGQGTSVGGSGPISGILAAPVPITFNGITIVPTGSAIIVGGKTISAGNAITIGSGIPVSVAPGGVVVVGGASITLQSTVATTTSLVTGQGASTDSSGIGAAVATGIGAHKNNASPNVKTIMIALKAGFIALALGAVGAL